MDETSVRLWPGARTGLSASSPSDTLQIPALPLEQRVSLREQRGAISIVGFICDDNTIQPMLPQFIIANKRIVPRSAAARFQAHRSDTVQLIHRQSSWLNAPTLRQLFRELGRALRAAAPDRFVILSMDACPTHLASSVLLQLAREKIHIVPIAARTTKWLQPMDVAAIRPLKAHIRAAYEREQLLCQSAVVPVSDALEIIAAAARDVLGGQAWQKAFQLCGMTDRPPTSRRFLRAMQVSDTWAIPNALPSLSQIITLLPKRRFVPVEHLFPLLMEKDKPREPRAPLSSPRSSAPGHAGVATLSQSERPWFGRTRSTSAVGVPPAATAEAPAVIRAPELPPADLMGSPPPRPRSLVPVARPWPPGRAPVAASLRRPAP